MFDLFNQDCALYQKSSSVSQALEAIAIGLEAIASEKQLCILTVASGLQ